MHRAAAEVSMFRRHQLRRPGSVAAVQIAWPQGHSGAAIRSRRNLANCGLARSPIPARPAVGEPHLNRVRCNGRAVGMVDVIRV